MSTYLFVINATISMHAEVEATSPEEAVKKAQAMGVQSLCHQCGRGDERTWNTSGELDIGDPADCSLEEVLIDGEEPKPTTVDKIRDIWDRG